MRKLPKVKISPKEIHKELPRVRIGQHVGVTLLAVGIMAFFAICTILAKPLDPIKRALQDFSWTDIYYEILKEGTPDTSRVITIVDLTRLTDRSDIARTISNIEACHPKVIGMDATFDHEGDDIDGNMAMIDVAEKYKNIVFAEKMYDWQGDTIGWTTCVHSFFHDMTDIKEGTVNMPRALYDRMKRRVPLGETYRSRRVPSLVSQVANAYAGKDIIKGRTGDVNINFSPTVFKVVKPEEVLKNRSLIEDHIVLFGSMYEESDMHWTPLGKMAGVELLAYGVQTVVYNTEVRHVPFVVFCLITFLIIYLVELLQTAYLRITSQSKHIFLKYVAGSTYFTGILTFLFLSVFIGASFFVFRWFNVSFNVAWAVSAVAFLGTSRGMYGSLTIARKMYKTEGENKQVQKQTGK